MFYSSWLVNPKLHINTIDVSALAAGVYRLVVRTDENILQQNFVK